MNLLKRDPAAYGGLVMAVLPILVTLGVLNWSTEHLSLVNAAVTAVVGLIVAARVRDVSLAVVTAAATAVLNLVVGFGLDLSPDTVASIMAAIPVVFGFVTRAGTDPIDATTLSPRASARAEHYGLAA